MYTQYDDAGDDDLLSFSSRYYNIEHCVFDHFSLRPNLLLSIIATQREFKRILLWTEQPMLLWTDMLPIDTLSRPLHDWLY